MAPNALEAGWAAAMVGEIHRRYVARRLSLPALATALQRAESFHGQHLAKMSMSKTSTRHPDLVLVEDIRVRPPVCYFAERIGRQLIFYDHSSTIRVLFVDLANVTRCRLLTVGTFLKLVVASRKKYGKGKDRAGVTMTAACLDGLVGLNIIPPATATGEHLFVFDLSSLRASPSSLAGAASHQITCHGFWTSKRAASPSQDLTLPHCPRSALARMEIRAKETGYEFTVGFETEFVLLDPETLLPAAVNPAGGYSLSRSVSASQSDKVDKCLAAVVSSIEAAGIPVLIWHAEAAPSQFEIATAPTSPLEAADALHTTREIIYNTAKAHDLVASLSPRIYDDSCGNSSHCHISVRRSPLSNALQAAASAFQGAATAIHGATQSSFFGKRLPSSSKATPPPPPSAAPAPGPAPATSENGLAPHTQSLLSGLLDHLPAICALGMPAPASYARVVDGIWSGGTYVAWGTDNRETVLRITGEKGEERIEVKSIDGTSNPWLVLTGLLGVGLAAIVEERKLEVKDCKGMPAALSDEERDKLGIRLRMPKTIGQAREALSLDIIARDALGEELAERFLGVNSALEKWLDEPESDSQKRARLLRAW